MAKDRITVCEHYICAELCGKGRKAEYGGYFQHCDLYVPRSKERHINKKKQKLDKIKKNDFEI